MSPPQDWSHDDELRLPPPPPDWGGGSAVALRPMSVGELLDGAFRLLRGHWRTLIIAAATIIIPVQVVTFLAQRGLVEPFARFAAVAGDSPDDLLAFARTELLPQLPQILAAALIGQLLLVLVAGAVAATADAAVRGADLGPGRALASAGRRAGALLVGWILAHLLELFPQLLALAVGVRAVVVAVEGSIGDAAGMFVVAFVLLFIGTFWGLFVMPLVALTVPVVMVEGRGPVSAVARSIRLARSRYWPVFAVTVLTGIVAGLVSTALNNLPQLFSGAVDSLDTALLLQTLGSIVASLIVLPFVALVTTLLYFDVRIRREAFDLDELAAQLSPPGAWPPPGAPGAPPAR